MNKIKMLRSLILTTVTLLLLAAGLNAQTEQDERRFIDATKVPMEGNSVADFVPQGWMIEKQINGDINFDSRPDVVLELVEKERTQDDERFRALLVLARAENGNLQRIAIADRLLADFHSGGMKCGTDGENVSIKLSRKGVLTIEQCLGGADLITFTHRFRYDPALRRLVLIGEDSENADPPSQITATSINYLTRVKLVTVYDDSHPKGVTRRERVATDKKLFIEDINNDNFWEP